MCRDFPNRALTLPGYVPGWLRSGCASSPELISAALYAFWTVYRAGIDQSVHQATSA
jgi:hypothetical protein